MVKKLAAYGAIAAGAAAVMLGAAPAQATGQPGMVGQPTAVTSYDDGRGGWWKRGLSVRKDQDNEANALLYLCDIHILGLDHLLVGKNEENAKCANASFNDN
jgi:hypothetical protein